ncbi:MAG: A/G-specific adenine glycosylase [Paludibacteraceae bacterium]|nr:A/G-specific adenine glycosylase [Paludibacteraceae bacterium]
MVNLTVFYRDLEGWYDKNHRVLPWRETTDPYKIWISEIILQQTRVDQGMEYYLRFIERFPTIQSIAAASEDDVLHLWQGLGYYSRARNIYKAAQLFSEMPSTYEELKQMPGVGDYTAGAIAGFAFNLPYPALDGNVYRVLARLSDSDIAFDTTAGKKYFHTMAEQLLDRERPRVFNNAIMEFGALYCVPQHPDCTHCPLQIYCQAYAHHTVDLLPVRKQRPKVRDRYFIYTIYVCQGQTIIHQRQGNDIWKHLWEFPLTEVDEKAYKQTTPAVELTHQLSHQRLHAKFMLKRTTTLPVIPDTVAVSLQDIEDYTFSRLTLRAMETLIPSLLYSKRTL